MLVCISARHACAQDSRTSDSAFAPIDKYLMDQNTEIDMARSAAPASISSNAEILVLGRKGYDTAVKGTNGFVCYVERSWTADIDDPGFGSPKLRYPICFNPAAARSYLPITLKKTELALGRPSKSQMFAALRVMFDNRELPSPEAGSMCYMMSKQAIFDVSGDHGGPHLMFFYPPTSGMAFGAGLKGSPVLVHQDVEDRLTVFVVPVSKFSDGSDAPKDEH